LSSKIVDFFAYKLNSSATSLQDVDLSELPIDLAMHLTLELHKTLLRKCFIFTVLPPRFLVPLLRQLRPMVAVPGELIVREGHRNEKLFFIHQGMVQVMVGFDDPDENKRKTLAKLSDNDFFGEASLIQDNTEGGESKGVANATIMCISYCEFLTLSKQQLDSRMARHMAFKKAIDEGVAMRNEGRSALPRERRGSAISASISRSVKRMSISGKRPQQLDHSSMAAQPPHASEGSSARLTVARLASIRRASIGGFDRLKRVARVTPRENQTTVPAQGQDDDD